MTEIATLSFAECCAISPWVVFGNSRLIRYLFQQMTEYSLYSESPCTLRNWLRTNRQARHLTLRTVAARLGVSHTWVSKVENGERRLDVFEYVNLCFALGLNPRAGLDLIITARSPYEQSGDTYPRAAEKKPAYGRKKPR